MKFFPGDIVKCQDPHSANSFGAKQRLAGLTHLKRMVVKDVRNYNDGSQTIWVKSSSRMGRREYGSMYGPYLSTRFMYDDNPRNGSKLYLKSQEGDRDDDI